MKELYEKTESEDLSLHEKIAAFRELHNIYNTDNKKEEEYYSKAKNSIRNIFRNTPPWKLDAASLTNDDVEWLSADQGKATSISTFREVGLGMNWPSVFRDWSEYLSTGEINKVQAETVEEQLIGVKNVAHLYSYDAIRNYTDVNGIPTDSIFMFNIGAMTFKGSVPELNDGQNGLLPDKLDDLKILILTQRQSGIWGVEARTMVESLPHEMIPEKLEETDILIRVIDTSDTNVKGPSQNRTVEYWGTIYMEAYDFKTGFFLVDITKEYGDIESFLQSLDVNP